MSYQSSWILKNHNYSCEFPLSSPSCYLSKYGSERADLSSTDSTPRWQPIFDVNTTRGEAATLMLISNVGIKYPSESFDPIFPAHWHKVSEWYMSAQWHASVLGCMSTTLVCNLERSDRECYPLLASFTDPDFHDPEHGPTRRLLWLSLLPDVSSQVAFLQAEALEAQSLLSGSYSAELPSTQWKYEVQQLFEQVLARTRIATRNMARGVGSASLPNKLDQTEPYWRDFCMRYKFRAVGWKNIIFNWFLGEFFAGLLVCLLGIRRDEEELWVERPAKRIINSQFGQLCIWALCVIEASSLWSLSKLWRDVRCTAQWYWSRMQSTVLLLRGCVPTG